MSDAHFLFFCAALEHKVALEWKFKATAAKTAAVTEINANIVLIQY